MVIKSRNPDKDAKITLLVGLVLAVIWIVSMFLPLFFYKDEARADPTGPGPYIIWRNANNWWDMEDGILKVPKIITDSIEGQLVDPILILAIDPTGPDTFVVEGDNANKAIKTYVTNLGAQTGEGANWVQQDWMVGIAAKDSIEYTNTTTGIKDSLPIPSTELILKRLVIQEESDWDWEFRACGFSVVKMNYPDVAHVQTTAVIDSMIQMQIFYINSVPLYDAIYVNEDGDNYLHFQLKKLAGGTISGTKYLCIRVHYVRADVP
jgi:hypothetical protein